MRFAAAGSCLVLLLSVSCDSKTAEPASSVVVAAEPTPPPPHPVPAVSAAALVRAPIVVAPERTPAELTEALRQACLEGAAAHAPLLLDFGANWCGDCKKLHGMKAQRPLAEELGHWRTVDINITDPDKHAALMDAYQVKAIARWVVLRPNDCSAPVTAWPRGPTRVVEPNSSGNATAEQLVGWLRAARG